MQLGKEVANDNTGIVVTLPEDAERVDRAVGIGSGRPRADPLPKMHNIQHSHRDTPNESTREKNIGAAYGDYEYDSDQGILAWELEELVSLRIEDSISPGIELAGIWQRQCPAKGMVLTSSMVFQVILPPD
ncbi:hypothetical protein Acr_12g0004460 [Actinidia rufa]|uniref:Uncharacterized protein n=1 Tax=Actinidia rufa TaxID=165716 RepID=A0A7J0FGT6_9ERIC|nr:hypothetical protein Acr_12g0004460 [Actinidia rufa]